MKKISYKLKSKLTEKKYPSKKKGFEHAHELADKAEKKKYGKKSYDALEKFDKKLKSKEIAGHHNIEGDIFVSEKVPKKFRSEVAYHEKEEDKIMRKRSKKSLFRSESKRKK